MVAILPNVSTTMSDSIGRYPTDSNIIDFIEVKMLQLADDYAKVNKLDMAEACWNALERYMLGEIDIYFKNGEPYVTKPNIFVTGSSEKK